MAVDKDFYNEASAAKLGWEPSWFIPEYTLFDRKLQSAICLLYTSPSPRD